MYCSHQKLSIDILHQCEYWIVDLPKRRMKYSYLYIGFLAFSALALLVGWQEWHPACKNWVVGCLFGYLPRARCRFAYGPAGATATHCLLLQEIQIGFGFIFLVLAYPGSPGQTPESRETVVVYTVYRFYPLLMNLCWVSWMTECTIWKHIFLMRKKLHVEDEKICCVTNITIDVQDTKEPACLRLFLDYQGLPLLWSWMVDVPSAAIDFKTQVMAITHTHTYIQPFYEFVRDYPGEPAPDRQNQEDKTNLDLLEQEIVINIGISCAICKSAPWPRHITTPASHHSVFYRPDTVPAAQPTASKHWRHRYSN